MIFFDLNNEIDKNQIFNIYGFFVLKENEKYLILIDKDLSIVDQTQIEFIHKWTPYECKKVSTTELIELKLDIIKNLEAKRVDIDFGSVEVDNELQNIICNAFGREKLNIEYEKVLEVNRTNEGIDIVTQKGFSRCSTYLKYSPEFSWYISGIDSSSISVSSC